MELLSLVVLNFGFLKENVITNVIWIHFFEKKMKLKMLKTLLKKSHASQILTKKDQILVLS